jgi:phage tail-like protein
MNVEAALAPPLVGFRFQVVFRAEPFTGTGGDPVPLCQGAFAECTGLEASMEAFAIREGGANYGEAQRIGTTSFATVVFKRGMTRSRDLWTFFHLVAGGGYAQRLTATVEMFDHAGAGVLAWTLRRALPVKFKVADLAATATEAAVEELHCVHEGFIENDDPPAGLFAGPPS